VYALEAGETRCVHRVDFDALRASHPSIDRMLVSLLALQVRRMDGLLTEAYYDDAGKRLLRRLSELAEVYDTGGADVVIPLTQEQLASLAGASRASVSAVLSAERKRGTVALRRGATVVRDREALARRTGRSQ
jgi:CRP-like cAMP-binding protein